MINSRRPDIVDDVSMTWRILPHVHLTVVLYSDENDDARPLDHGGIAVLLKGGCRINHYWHFAPSIVRLRKGQPFNVKLRPARTYEEGLFDLRWMEQRDIHYNTERRLWLLTITGEK